VSRRTKKAALTDGLLLFVAGTGFEPAPSGRKMPDQGLFLISSGCLESPSLSAEIGRFCALLFYQDLRKSGARNGRFDWPNDGLL